MKKLGIVLGVAAVATITGCKDPDYVSKRAPAPQDEVKSVETTPAPEAEPAPETVVETTAEEPVQEVTVVDEKHCTCAPGTKHAKPCECGGVDCLCVVEEKPAEPEYTIYIVQRDDTLSKISKKYNIKIASILSLNPSIKGDVIRIGQKLKLPGKVEVGEQTAPVAAKPAKKAFQPYTGATVEYVVKSGDTLGAIAYGHGINIRQLKELNGLSSDVVRVGQKLKVPADGKPASKPAAKPAAKPVAETPAPAVVEPAPAEQPVEEVAPVVEEPAPVETVAPVAAPVPEVPTTTYVVQEGDDMTSVSISWGVSAAAIRELNNLGEGDQLQPGQVIKLPADTQL